MANFCQDCGSPNTDQARFCNMCGVGIAKPGTPAGRVSKPIVPTTNQPTGPAGGMSDTLAARAASEVHGGGTSMLSVSLDAIGVRSTGKTWGRILLIAGALMALGAFGMWIAMHNEQEGTEETGAAEPDDPFMIGAPVPSGADTPDVDFVTGKTTSTGKTTTAQKTAQAKTRRSNRSSGGVTGGSSGSGSTMTSSMKSSNSGGAGSGSSGSTGSAGSGSSGAGSTGSGSGGSTGSGSDGELPPPDTGGSTEDPPERDIAMDLYSAKVRSVVRRYYAPRAQSCFNRATKNNPALHGTVVINMTVGASGQVSKTSVQRNSTGDSNLATCLKGQVKSWKLPPPPAGSLEMQLPFSR